MPTSKVQAASGSLPNLSLKMPEGFLNKVMAPRIPKLVQREERPRKLAPSAYAQEMSQTTEERLANTVLMHPPRILELLDMSETTHQKFSSINIDQALFQPYPSEIVFQNFQPLETYQIPLVLRNNDKVPRMVKVVDEQSLYFKVLSPADIGTKVAPGMVSTFTVLFTPQENKDYVHRLLCATERELFEVPVHAIGARAILDFPDQVHLPPCPVKGSTQRTMLVRNVGNAPARFQLNTQSPFSVSPSTGAVGVGEIMQLTVDFLPKTVGDHNQDLVLQYDTAEALEAQEPGNTGVIILVDRHPLQRGVVSDQHKLSPQQQLTADVSHRVFCPVTDLGEHRSYPHRGSIRLQDEGLVKGRGHQDRFATEGSSQGAEGVFCFLRPVDLVGLPLGRQAHVALGSVGSQTSLPEGPQHRLEPGQVGLPVGTMDHDVIQVCRCVLPMGSEDLIHNPLEGGWGPVEPKRYGLSLTFLPGSVIMSWAMIEVRPGIFENTSRFWSSSSRRSWIWCAVSCFPITTSGVTWGETRAESAGAAGCSASCHRFSKFTWCAPRRRPGFSVAASDAVAVLSSGPGEEGLLPPSAISEGLDGSSPESPAQAGWALTSVREATAISSPRETPANSGRMSVTMLPESSRASASRPAMVTGKVGALAPSWAQQVVMYLQGNLGGSDVAAVSIDSSRARTHLSSTTRSKRGGPSPFASQLRAKRRRAAIWALAGEEVHVSVYGASSDMNVRLERGSVLLERTYLGLANQRSLGVVNRSPALLHYRWSTWATEQEEEEESGMLQREQEGEMEHFLQECGADPTVRDRLSLLSRTFQERRRQLQEHPLVAGGHGCFTLQPTEGDLWPNSSAEVNIVFKPLEAKVYQHTVYLDITGRQARLPLRIKGEGLGPKLKFNFDLLDMGNIFIGSKHRYEVLVSNPGLINAPFKVQCPDSTFGSCFSFSPAEGAVPPGACHALEVHFSCSSLGTFSEDFLLHITGSPQPLTLTFRGRVMGPTFHFDVPELRFGDVSFGFPQTLSCSLSNSSLVPMTFDLRVPGDGAHAASRTSGAQVCEAQRSDWACRGAEPAVEFTLSPASGTLRPQGQLSIQVTLCSNRLQSYMLALVVDVEGVGKDVLALPITARCVVPEVVVETPVLEFQRCFLGYPYERTVKLSNPSELPACYGLLFQDYQEHPALLFSSAHPRGVVQPGSAVDIPLVLQAKMVGRLQHTAHIAVFGQEQPPLEVVLSCIGEGPVLHIPTTELDFGRIPVLTNITRTLELANQSPIPAHFSARMVRGRSRWRVEPVEGRVPPEGRLELRLVARLDDTLAFQERLLLDVRHSQTLCIQLRAVGTGTTIVADRPLAPSLDLGSHFSSGPCQYHFRLTNRGRRTHQLYWTTEGFSPFRRRHPPASTARSREGRAPPRAAPLPATPEGPVFSLTPARMELAPGQSADVVLEGSSDSPKVVRERLVCQAILAGQSGKEGIMTADVTCRFVAPVLHISSPQLDFYVEKVPGQDLVPLYQQLVLRNVSSLALALELILDQPFSLCEQQEEPSLATSKSMVLGLEAEVEVWVRFDPAYRPDRVSRVAEGVLAVRYRDHPQRDGVGLRGQVHFPNLHFSSAALDFGCVLNHTETQRQLTMTNLSPLDVAYRWAFMVDQRHYAIRFPQVTEGSEGQPGAREEEKDGRWDWSKNTESKQDSNRETEVPQPPLEEELEKRDPENATKEGRGSPKEEVLWASPSPGNTHSTGSVPEEDTVGVEEVFDILPIYGLLRPGESQQVTFSFYGHAHISGQVLALCQVEEGPVYDITLKGEASLVKYSLDTMHIDLGLQLFDRVAQTEVTLRNTGRVDFTFSTLLGGQDALPGGPRARAKGPEEWDTQEAGPEGLGGAALEELGLEEPIPGQPLVIPSTGYIEAGAAQRLHLFYLPGVPEVFHKSFQLQVAFYQPDLITLTGEGIFPRLCLDLPRQLAEERYVEVVRQAKAALEVERCREEGLSVSRPTTRQGLLSQETYIPTYDGLLQMEIERLLVKENAVAMESSLVEHTDTPGSSSRWRKRLSRFLLPEYILDFGYVIHGEVPAHVVKVTNAGPVAATFRADRRPLSGTGFNTELDKVRNLPYCETETFQFTFDPRGANLEMGEVSVLMPIQVVGGPTVQVRLRAVVTMPALTVSTDTLQFDRVQCGLCQVTTVQLFNHKAVPCQWSIAPEKGPRKKINKHVPLHLRQRARLEQSAPSVVFEMLPSSGLLHPGDRVNVQVKFSPGEGRSYTQRLVVCVLGSSQRAVILAQGSAEEPQLELSSSVLELGPTLPYSLGEEAQVTVRNPCPFPIEFYSLEFDKQYLEEEKVLRLMKGYDEQNILLLPPRAPGDPLPPELLDYYREHRFDLPTDEDSSPKDDVPEGGEKGEGPEEEGTSLADQSNEEEKEAVLPGEGAPCGGELSREGEEGGRAAAAVGTLEVNPVSRAIARHMGIDLSPEGQAARNRRGIATIVYGAPLSGKTSTAVALARHYGGACLTFDGVIAEAVATGTSAASQQARQLSERAVTEQAQRRVEETVQAVPEVSGPTPPVSSSRTGLLSVDAVAKHTAEGAPPAEVKPLTSSASKAQNSSLSARNKNSTGGGGKKAEGSQPTATSMGGATQRQVSVSGSQAGELGLVLPEQLLVELLAERLQLSDCHRGVVMDGLESVYTRSVSNTLQVALKAFNHRKHIYVVNLCHTYPALKALQKAQREADAVLRRERADRERQRLQEMDEEEYDALPEEEKERIDLRNLETLRERKRREQEKAEREQVERRQQEELDRLKEEEEMKRKSKKGKKEAPKEDMSGKKSQLGGKQSALALRSETKLDQNAKDNRKMSYTDGKESKDSPTESSKELEEAPKKKKPKDGKGGGHEDSSPATDDAERDTSSDLERQLLARFRAYEQIQPQVVHILLHWDRVQGVLLVPLFPDEAPTEPEEVPQERQVPSGKKTKKEREKEKQGKERLEKEKQAADADVKLPSPTPSQAGLLWDGGEAGPEREGAPEAVPHVLLHVAGGREEASARELLGRSKLPPLEEVLDGLGLGPRGPPVPPPTLFSVVPYPRKRTEPGAQLISGRFQFLVPSSPEDLEEKKEELEADAQAASAKDEVAAVPKSRGKKGLQGVVAAAMAVATMENAMSKDSQKEKKRTPAKKGAKASESRSPPLSSVTPLPDSEQGSRGGDSQDRGMKLTTFRWIVPANGEVTLKIWFHSSSPGKYDQTLNFELLGTRRRYQLYCRGICAYPSICKDYKTVFTHAKKVLQSTEDLQRTYVIRPALYEFGPLLCGKTRDRYKERKYPENLERLAIHNNSPLDAEVTFCFQYDTKAATFLLDPPCMTLKPGQTQELVVWAYPTSPGRAEDCVVCCIKENPEPVLFRLGCRGVRPELELDRKQLHFDKILLHRKDTRSLQLRNKTLLPAAWRLSGLEVLGEEFNVSQDQGIILPHSSFTLQVDFRAMKPINMKRAIRLEVSDVDNILGIVHTENIQILAEAYDVALDVTFPKGADGGLDFGTIKVCEEVKLSLNMKNKGKYDIAYKFTLESTQLSQPDLSSIFTVTPQRGVLGPTDRPSGVQFVFRHNKEVVIKDEPILRCQVIEPSIGDGGETIAIIPIKVSVQSLFTRYNIAPPGDINFGPLVYGAKKSQAFTIENKGEFEIRFSISRMAKEQPLATARRGVLTKRLSRENHSAKPPAGQKVRRTESIQKDMCLTQARFTMGVFTVSPGFGVLAPGAHQLVTVDCVAEQVGCWTECLAIDVSDRDPADSPGGIPYRLVAEVCLPGIVDKDLASVFEEHRLCRSSGQLYSEQYREADGVFVLDDNRFVFNNVLVGRSGKARFKLSNQGKVPAELSLAVKSVTAKRNVEVFDLSPSRLCIGSHSHAFAVVTFSPQTMQTYQATLEVTLEGTTRGKALAFDLVGEGNLPSVTVLRPALRSAQGRPVLQFRRLLVGRSQTLPLLLQNDSSVPAEVHMDFLDRKGAFAFQAAPGTTCRSIYSTPLEGAGGKERPVAHSASFRLGLGQQAAFLVTLCPRAEGAVQAHLRLQVDDNPYEDMLVRLAGEGYHDIVALENVGSAGVGELNSGGTEQLHFGDCQVGVAYQQSFTMANQSSGQALKFEWPATTALLSFSPQVGHLHAGCSKEVTVTFCSQQPATLAGQPLRCKVCRVEFPHPLETVADWDDRQRTVRWLDVGKPGGAQPQPAKKKVVETDPEPACTVVEGSHQELELRVSAVCDYARFTCSAQPLRFRDTMLYQTRVYQLKLVNTGSVKLDFSWQVFMERFGSNIGLGDVTPRSSHSRSMAVRPASALESVTCLMLGDPEQAAFSVEPSVGALSPGATQTFSLRYSPVEVAEAEARLVCSIPNLKEEQGPSMVVSGRSLLPYCHFHLEPSDYITGSRRNPDLRGPHGAQPRAPLDPSTMVIEFTAVGVGTRVPKRFSVVNPTNKAYSFQWRCEDMGPSPFSCLTPGSSIQPGRKVEVAFEFVAQCLELVESFWTFLIPERSLSMPFLLAGSANEPLVYLDRAHLNMGALLVGRRTEQTVYLVNSEERAFSFSVVETSRQSETFRTTLTLEPSQGTVAPREQPSQGTVAPRSRLPVVLWFTPSQEGVVNFNLVVGVQGKVEPLALNVKADGYIMSAYIQLENPQGGVELLAPDTKHTMDFGQVELADKVSCSLLLTNPGRFSLDVELELWGAAGLQRHLQVEPLTHNVKVGRQVRSKLTFFPQSTCTLKDMGLNVRIKHGPGYMLSFQGSAVAPGLHFSFLKHNFGMSFLYCAGMVPASQTLVIRNKGERGISLDCQFQNTAYLEVAFQPEVLPPGGVVEVPVTFYPREARRYSDKLTFVLNDCAKQVVEIQGQGIEMKVELLDPGQRQVNLGALLVGQRVKKVVPLVNNSPSALTISLLLNTNEQNLMDARVLTFSPAGEVTLKPSGGRCSVELAFSPRQRMAPFAAELQAECCGVLRPLVALTGCCQGVEVRLDQDYLPFGAVVQRCRATRRIMMANTGDIGARFQWDIERFGPDFSIAPAEGYICPGTEMPLDVTFAPVEPSQELRYDNLACSVEGAAKPTTLTLAGSCIPPPVTKEVVTFVCPVRGQQTHTLKLDNRSSQRWSLSPVIEGECWSGAPSLIVEANQQGKAYEITYRPMSMAGEGKKHQGSVFFSFPDGTGLLYLLQGTAEAPKAVATLSHELPCKTPYTQLVPIHNWLDKPQRFRAVIEITKPERPDSTVLLRGLDYIDVPALTKRDYKLSFYSYKEGQYNGKVTFRNEATGEYLFYFVGFKATPPGLTQSLEMSTPVRQTASASVTLDNPLPAPLVFNVECRCAEVSAPPQLAVPGLSKGTLTFEFQPLRAGESTVRLTLHNGELGSFLYELLLRALPPAPEKPLYFRAALGSSHGVAARFTNFSRAKAEYTCKTDCPEFAVEKNALAPPGYQAGTEVSVEVLFEPCQLGELRGLLTLFSPLGGEYSFPLHGTCTPPKAQGPFPIRAGSNVSIPFKNVFQQTTAFAFQVDNPTFTVKGVETIRSKKTHNILVMFEPPQAGSRVPCSGKLTITSPRAEAHGQPISWVFYLKGFFPEPVQREKTS
ncbi:hydrocephalus-inducing protein homolog [Aplochiton taeniatus]